MPIMRMNICDPVATPRSRHATVPWIATIKVVLQNPMPLPISTDPATGHTHRRPGVQRQQHRAAGDQRWRRRSRTVSRYEVWTISRPATIEATIQLTDAAPTTNPLTPAL